MQRNVLLWDIAAQYGDVLYVTSDNPAYRGSCTQLLKNVEVGVKDGLREGTHYEVIVIVEAFNMLYNMQNLEILYSLQVRGMRITKS